MDLWRKLKMNEVIEKENAAELRQMRIMSFKFMVFSPA